MRKINNYEEIQEAGDFKNVVAGGYIAVIKSAVDYPNKEYLKIELDIAKGEFAGYYQELFDKKAFWGLSAIRSYSEKALPFFKGFATSVENSNRNFKFDFDETKLVGKQVGIILGEEYYIGNDGSNKKRLIVSRFVSAETISKGDFEIPEPVVKDGATIQTQGKSIADSFGSEVNSDEVPF